MTRQTKRVRCIRGDDIGSRGCLITGNLYEVFEKPGNSSCYCVVGQGTFGWLKDRFVDIEDTSLPTGTYRSDILQAKALEVLGKDFSPPIH
jgi:hypothetical protein